MKKKLVCLCLIFTITASQILSVSAAKESEIKAQKEETSNKLSEANSKISSLEGQLDTLRGEIEQTNSELVDVMVEIDVLEGEITDKTAKIEVTKEELKKAEENRDEQYDSMKERIEYIYENGGKNAWAQMLLEAKSLTSFLNRAENTQQLYEYDRKSLNEYISTVTEVQTLGEQLESEKSELEQMQESLEGQKVVLQQKLDEKKATSSNYDSQLSTIKNQADQYKKLIQQQNQQLRAIEEEKKRQEEAARKEAERREAARREAEREAQREEERNQSNSNNSSSNSNSNSSSNSNSNSNNNSNSGNNSKPSKDETPSEPSKVPSSSIGSAAANYALQFVGNPYVWGGTSLTNGADCSGFIMSVYAKFGISLPHSSSALRGVGRGVSYSEAQPGDIICYSGHVAIYIGGGAIVHASNAKDGIKVSPNAAYRTILAVRRVG